MSKKKHSLLDCPDYSPNTFLDWVQTSCGLKNDAALCRVLGINPPEMSRIRKCRRPITAIFLVKLHLYLGVDISMARKKMGDTRKEYE